MGLSAEGKGLPARGTDLMTSLMSNVLMDCLWERSSRLADALAILAFSLLTALAAQVAVKLPFTPVPLTGQTFAVLLSGAVLGSRRGFLSQAIYLAEGAVGLPVFALGASSFAHLLGPTGGYLWSYPLAAGLLGWLIEQGASRSFVKLAAALFVSDLLILVCGDLWLHVVANISYRQAWLLGFYPFLVGDAAKVVLVGVPLPRIMRLIEAHRGACIRSR
jgi:biotin transport system substrate-specific component